MNRFGWIVVPFAKQIDALKEQHASMVEEVLDEELLKEGLLRKETRVMQNRVRMNGFLKKSSC